jgi:hypothetical protein
MVNINLQRNWKLIEVLLQNALSTIVEQPASDVISCGKLLDEARNFISHNELDLALDSLAEAGRLSFPRAKFWDSLRQAAEIMELDEKALEFQLLWVESASNSLS